MPWCFRTRTGPKTESSGAFRSEGKEKADGIIFSGASSMRMKPSPPEGTHGTGGGHRPARVEFPVLAQWTTWRATQAARHLLELGHERIGFIPSGSRRCPLQHRPAQGLQRTPWPKHGRHFDAGLVKQGISPRKPDFRPPRSSGPEERPRPSWQATISWPSVRSVPQGSLGLRVPQDLPWSASTYPAQFLFEPLSPRSRFPCTVSGPPPCRAGRPPVGREFSRIRLFTTVFS